MHARLRSFQCALRWLHSRFGGSRSGWGGPVRSQSRLWACQQPAIALTRSDPREAPRGPPIIGGSKGRPNYEGPHLLLYTLGLLCAFAAAVFATAVRDTRGAIALSVGFLIGVAWWSPAPGWTGTLVGAMAVVMLFAPHRASVLLAASIVSGLTGGLWAQILAGYGLPAWLAWSLAGGVTAVSAVASQCDPRFARPAVREDALVAISVLGVTVAAAPGVAAGWRAAGGMNLAANDMFRPSTNPGMLLGLAAMLSLGGLHSLWRRG